MARWKVWAFAAVLLGLAAGYAALSFVAAIGLGYDTYPGGKEIISGWGAAMLALLASSIVCALLAWRWLRASLRR